MKRAIQMVPSRFRRRIWLTRVAALQFRHPAWGPSLPRRVRGSIVRGLGPVRCAVFAGCVGFALNLPVSSAGLDRLLVVLVSSWFGGPLRDANQPQPRQVLPVAGQRWQSTSASALTRSPAPSPERPPFRPSSSADPRRSRRCRSPGPWSTVVLRGRRRLWPPWLRWRRLRGLGRCPLRLGLVDGLRQCRGQVVPTGFPVLGLLVGDDLPGDVVERVRLGRTRCLGRPRPVAGFLAVWPP